MELATISRRAYEAEYRARNRDRLRAYRRAWYAKNIEKCRATSLRHYYANKDACLKANKAWVARNRDRVNLASWQSRNPGKAKEIRVRRCEKNAPLLRALIADAKRAGCSKCKESDPACLDFHHRDELLKTRAVSTMARGNTAVDTARAEILRCDVLCSNCHRKLHAATVVRGRGTMPVRIKSRASIDVNPLY